MKYLRETFRIVLPFALGLGILWWMYRGTDWEAFVASVQGQMKWGWMCFSFVFGILAQMMRAWRWKMALSPVDEHPRRTTCENAIFVSYAASLVVPRIGEVTRCTALKTYDGVSFSKSLGTVVTERIVDSGVMLLLTAAALLLQIPAFTRFARTTGLNVGHFLGQFTLTGYMVTLLCLFAAVGAALFLLRRRFAKGRDVLSDIRAGILSLRHVSSVPLYAALSFGINACYFLHFYTAFFCFDFTSHIGVTAAFLIYCIGMFAVLVPTPNGAGSWHFAVKTMLVLYGVQAADAILFALVVHTLQTGLVVALGIYGWTALNLRRHSAAKIHKPNTSQYE